VLQTTERKCKTTNYFAEKWSRRGRRVVPCLGRWKRWRKLHHKGESNATCPKYDYWKRYSLFDCDFIVKGSGEVHLRSISIKI